MAFLLTKDGLHYSVHASGNPHLKNKFGKVAELDLEALRMITPRDMMSLFRYLSTIPKLLMIPISIEQIQMFPGTNLDPPKILDRLFSARTICVMRSRHLREFFRESP